MGCRSRYHRSHNYRTCSRLHCQSIGINAESLAKWWFRDNSELTLGTGALTEQARSMYNSRRVQHSFFIIRKQSSELSSAGFLERKIVLLVLKRCWLLFSMFVEDKWIFGMQLISTQLFSLRTFCVKQNEKQRLGLIKLRCYFINMLTPLNSHWRIFCGCLSPRYVCQTGSYLRK